VADVEENFVVDNLDTQAGRMELGESDDLHIVEGSHCPLEPCGLAHYCQNPYELEGP